MAYTSQFLPALRFKLHFFKSARLKKIQLYKSAKLPILQKSYKMDGPSGFWATVHLYKFAKVLD